MLQEMRKSSRSVIAVMMFIILILSFGVWGIGDIFRNTGTDLVVAEVADVKIYARELRQRYNSQLETLQAAGQPLTSEQALARGLPNFVLQGLVGDALRQKVADDFGLATSDTYIRDAVLAEPGFRNQLGVFDRNVYQSFLQRAGLNEQIHIAQLKRDFAASQLFGTFEEALAVPAEYRDLVYRFRFERRTAQSALLPFASISDNPVPTDEALNAYYEANKSAFGLPEFRKLRYVYVNAEDVVASIEVSDARIAEEYAARRSEFTAPETRDVDQALLDSEEKAKQVVDLIAGGTGLPEATKQVLGNDGGVISLGEVTRGDLPPALAEAAFATPAGQTSAPVQSPLGWHVIKVNKITAASEKPLADVRDEVIGAIRMAAAPDLLLSQANELERQLNRGGTFEEAAQSIGAAVKEAPAIDANGNGPDGSPAVDVPNIGDFVRRAFALRKGEESALTELANGDFFVMQVTDVSPPRIPGLDEIREKVTAAWRQVEIAKLAEERAKAMVERINGGADFVETLKAERLEPAMTPPFTRNANDPASNMPAALATAVFAAEPGKAVYAATANGIAIARVEEIQPADPAGDQAGVDATGRQMETTMRDTVRFAVDDALRKRYPVTIDQQVVNQTFATER